MFRTIFPFMLEVTRVLVLAETPTSSFTEAFTFVVTLCVVLHLTEPGMRTFCRLLVLHILSLIGNSAFPHLIALIRTLTCLFRTCALLANIAFRGTSWLLIVTGLSNWTCNIRLLDMARALRI